MEHTLPQHSQPVPALTLALGLSFIGLFGSATTVSLVGPVNMAFTMPIAAVLFVALVVVLFCYRRAETTYIHARSDSGSTAVEAAPASTKPARFGVDADADNVVQLRAVQTADGRMVYRRA